jgi:hypothetical protein
VIPQRIQSLSQRSSATRYRTSTTARIKGISKQPRTHGRTDNIARSHNPHSPSLDASARRGSIGLTDDVEHETDEPVVRCQWKQQHIHQENVLEVVNDALSVQEIHCCGQKIPVETFGELKILLSRWNICNRNNFLERHHLHHRDNGGDIDMPGSHRPEEYAYHC